IGRVLLLAVAFLGILVVQQVVRILVVLVLMAVVLASIASVASVVIGRPVGWLRLGFGCTAARVGTCRVVLPDQAGKLVQGIGGRIRIPRTTPATWVVAVAPRIAVIPHQSPPPVSRLRSPAHTNLCVTFPVNRVPQCRTGLH